MVSEEHKYGHPDLHQLIASAYWKGKKKTCHVLAQIKPAVNHLLVYTISRVHVIVVTWA